MSSATTYPLNAPRAVRRRAASATWRLIVQGWTAEPACSGRWQRLFTLLDVLDRALPEICGADRFAFRKRW